MKLTTVTLTFPADYDGLCKLTAINGWLAYDRLPLFGLLEFPPEPAPWQLMVPMAKARVVFTEEQQERTMYRLADIANSMDWPHARLHWHSRPVDANPA